jgi:hypothetical protein
MNIYTAPLVLPRLFRQLSSPSREMKMKQIMNKKMNITNVYYIISIRIHVVVSVTMNQKQCSLLNIDTYSHITVYIEIVAYVLQSVYVHVEKPCYSLNDVHVVLHNSTLTQRHHTHEVHAIATHHHWHKSIISSA